MAGPGGARPEHVVVVGQRRLTRRAVLRPVRRATLREPNMSVPPLISWSWCWLVMCRGALRRRPARGSGLLLVSFRRAPKRLVTVVVAAVLGRGVEDEQLGGVGLAYGGGVTRDPGVVTSLRP